MPHDFQVVATRRVFCGRVLSLDSDLVVMPGGSTSQRDVVRLPGAVAIVALDQHSRVLLVRQYRHPVGRRLWEIPAGLLDSTVETPLAAAVRELAEEGCLTARRWDCLVDTLTSPGMADETVRVLLARELSEVPLSQRHVAFDEEADMEIAWVSLEEGVSRVMSGDIENGITVAGLLAASIALSRGTLLRPVDAIWPARRGEPK